MAAGGTTLNVAVAGVPVNTVPIDFAVSVPEVLADTGMDVTETVAEDAFGAIVSVAGAGGAAGTELDSATCAPESEARPSRVTVTAAVTPPIRMTGAMLTDF